jgi:asparaginyl-tRNA synthetase
MSLLRSQDDMQCAEDYVRFCAAYVLEHCMPDLQFLVKMIDATAIERLQQVRGASMAWLSTYCCGRMYCFVTCKGACCTSHACAFMLSCAPLTAQVASTSFGRCSYTEGIELLQKAIAGGHKFTDMVSRRED